MRTTTRGGRTIMASIGPVGGGAGGGPYEDGAEGSGANMSFLKNTPVEISESEIPILIHKYGLVPDSGGAGLHRGGSALLMEFQLFAPQSMVTARNRDRSMISAWGVEGGQPGAQSSFTRNPYDASPEELRNTDIVPLQPGDTLRLIGPGAGGYGPAHERAVEKVVDDVRGGFVSPARARSDYGVALNPDGSVDAVETAKLRKAMAERATTEHFSHGPGRVAFESVWTRPRYALLTRILREVPVSWRFYVKHELFRALEGRKGGSDGGTSELLEAYGDLAARFEDLPPASTFGREAAVQVAAE